MKHTHLLLVLAALVPACSAPSQSLPARTAGDVRPTATIDEDEGTFEGKASFRLYERSWRPKGEARAVVVVMHGLKDHSARYGELAEALVPRGFAVHAFDLRGHGRSEGPRVWVSSFDDYVDDLERFVSRVKGKHPGRKVFVLGHSMGGAIVTLFAETRTPPVDGVVLSAAALHTDASGATKFGTRAVESISPHAALFQLDLEKFSRDKAVVDDARRDPLVYQAAAPVHTATELLGAMDRIERGAPSLMIPMLVMHGTKDQVTDPEGSKRIVEAAPSHDKTLKLYPGLYHDLLHEPEKAKVTADVLAWLEAHAPAAP